MREWTSMRTLSSEAPPPPLLAPPEDLGLAGASWDQILRFVSQQNLTVLRTTFSQFWQYLVQALFLGLWQGRPVLRSTITVVWAEWALLLGHLWHSVLAKLCNVYTFQIFLFTKGCSIFQEAQVDLRSWAQLVWSISVIDSACKKDQNYWNGPHKVCICL